MLDGGEKMSWEKITRKELYFLVVDENLSNSAIAELFGVTVSKVQYKKTKLGLTGTNLVYAKFARDNKELMDELNRKSMEWFLEPRNTDILSKSITRYIFRNGPIEDVHEKCDAFSDDDMKRINIFMVNHIAGLLTYALSGNWLQLRVLLDYFSIGSNDWHPAEAEIDKIDNIFYSNFDICEYIDKIPMLVDIREAVAGNTRNK